MRDAHTPTIAYALQLPLQNVTSKTFWDLCSCSLQIHHLNKGCTDCTLLRTGCSLNAPSMLLPYWRAASAVHGCLKLIQTKKNWAAGAVDMAPKLPYQAQAWAALLVLSA